MFIPFAEFFKKKRTPLVLSLDRYVCGALVILCRLFFKKNLPPRKISFPVREIVVAKYVGLGSILLTQKVLSALKEAFPEARLTFATFDSNKELLSLMGHADDILTVRTTSLSSFFSSSRQLVLKLRKRKIDIFFDLEFFSRYSSLVSFFSGARTNVGYRSKRLRCRNALYSHLTEFISTQHVIKNFFDQMKVLGLPVPEGKNYPELDLSQALLDLARQKFSEIDDILPGEYTVFNPSASEALGGYRRWPPDKWARLIKFSLEKEKRTIVLTGLSQDKGVVSEILGLLEEDEKKQVRDLSGRLSLKEYLALLYFSDLVVTLDSGTSHFSAALGKPTVILFGPETPLLYGYDAPHCGVVYKALSCSPCYNIYDGKKVICRNARRCMTTLTAEEVFKQMEALATSSGSLESSGVNLLK